MDHEQQPVVVSTTCDSEQMAHQIGKHVLEKRLAACVQILPAITSLYWWQKEIAKDDEFLVTMKSDHRLFERLAGEIRSIHPYEVPEIIATPIVGVDEDYARWMKEELDND